MITTRDGGQFVAARSLHASQANVVPETTLLTQEIMPQVLSPVKAVYVTSSPAELFAWPAFIRSSANGLGATQDEFELPVARQGAETQRPVLDPFHRYESAMLLPSGTDPSSRVVRNTKSRFRSGDDEVDTKVWEEFVDEAILELLEE
jgi:hypothetical protein